MSIIVEEGVVDGKVYTDGKCYKDIQNGRSRNKGFR